MGSSQVHDEWLMCLLKCTCGCKPDASSVKKQLLRILWVVNMQQQCCTS
jgi:hypothetical protein